MAETLTAEMQQEAQQETAERSWRQQLFASRLGRTMVAGIAAAGFGGAGELLTADSAYADGQSNLGSVTIINRSAKASVEDIVTKRVLFGEDEHISERGINRSQDCFRAKVFWNSMRTARGIVFFKDHNGVLCHSSHSPTGLIKIGGGETGRNCGNEAETIGHHPRHVVPKHTRIINVSNFNMKIKVKATAKANASANCPNSSASSGAEASVYQTIRLRRLLRMKGSGQVHFGLSLFDRALTKANAQAQCNETTTTTPPTPPPPPAQNHPPTGQGNVEHRFVNTTAPACLEVSDQDGDSVTATDFHFLNTSTGQPVGTEVGTPFPTDSTQTVWCENWTSPDTPQSVTWFADLRDSRGATGESTPDEFPVLANDTGPTASPSSFKVKYSL